MLCSALPMMIAIESLGLAVAGLRPAAAAAASQPLAIQSQS